MSTPIQYNSKTIVRPFQSLSIASNIIDLDHLVVVGATGDAAKPRYVGRQEGAGTATIAVATATEADRYGVWTITPDGTSGGRICQEAGTVFLSATTPWVVEAAVKFVTAGSYFVGLATATNSATPIISAGAIGSTMGVGVAIQTDDKCDIISKGSSANTAVADMMTLTAGTWYRVAIKAWTTRSEAYIDGRLVGTQTHTYSVTGAMAPSIAACTANAAKILTADWIAVGYG